MLKRLAFTQKSASSRLGTNQPRLLVLGAGLSFLVVVPTGCLSDVSLPPGCAAGANCSGSTAQGGEAPGAANDGGNRADGGSDETRTSSDAGMAGAIGGSDDGGAGSGSAGSANAGSGSAGAANAGAANAGAANAGSGSAGSGSAGAANAGAANAGTSSAGNAGTGGATGCPNCQITPLQLPNPCGSDHYSTPLYVSGGTGPYHWHVDANAGNWSLAAQPNSIDGSTAQLTGDPSGKTELTVTVSDALGSVKQLPYSLEPRTACYIAYVYSTVNGAKLSLRDPLLPDVDASASLAHNTGVYDFRFSPDGRFLAYHYGADADHPHGAHLSLFNFADKSEQALAFQEDAVNAYAWSPDSKVLAVALSVGGESQLSGVRLTSTGAGATVTALTPVVAVDPPESDLYWVGSSAIGFYTADAPDQPVGPGLITVFDARLANTGFSAPVAFFDAFFKPGILVTPAPGGLFVTSPSDIRSVFEAFASPDHSVYHKTDFIDPGGRYSAAVQNDTFQIFQAANNVSTFETSSALPESDCPKLLTWASNSERIACVANVSQTNAAWGEIRIFDILNDTPHELVPSIVKGSCLKGPSGAPLNGSCSNSEYDYDELSSTAQPRLLSPSGDWLAFVTGSQTGVAGALYWANLRTQPMALSRRVLSTGTGAGSPIALAFSPSGRYLLRQNGNELWAHLLTAGALDAEDLQIETDLRAPASGPCSEDFVTAPTRWCGGANASTTFVWSSDPTSELLAYRKLDQIISVQLTPNTLAPSPWSAPLCNDSCSGQFTFQPPLPSALSN